MSLLDTLTRHRIIIQKLRVKPCSFEEIQGRLNKESEITGGNYVVSIRTFQRDLQDISTLYSIEIAFNKSTKKYEIVCSMADEYSERMFEAFDIYQALKSRDDFSEYIQFDTRKPSGTGYLAELLVAVRDRKQIKITYQKFWSDTFEERTLEPYLLKEFRRRWYVFAYELNSRDFRVFGLDRIRNLLETGLKFQHPKTVHPKEYFTEVFGIIGSSGDFTTQDIVLSFRKSPADSIYIPNQGEYLKTMPLHASQEIMKDTPEEIIFKVRLKPNWEFMMELLGYGEYVEVLEPASLRDDLQKRLKAALKMYSNAEIRGRS